MGYEIGRFEGEVDEELLCPICSCVLEDPVQVCVAILLVFWFLCNKKKSQEKDK
jgi:hypothetical protein